MEKIEFKEIVELFLNTTIHQIKFESEVPNINFLFKEDGIELFKNVIENPFVKKGYWTPNASETDLDLLMRQDEDVITISVNDAYLFFELLKEIVNSQIKLDDYYNIKSFSRNIAMKIMRRIWLRMGIEDISNVELFLKRQLEFTNSLTFDTYDFKKVGSFYDYDVLMKTMVNATYDESTRSMIFYIKGNTGVYELPSILYDVDSENRCYIYGVQNSISKLNKDKKIERKMYKINKGIENPNVHPSKVYAMLYFISELEKQGITKIIVPSMQVLNYRYHELLSIKAKKDLIEIQEKLIQFPNDEMLKENYFLIKKWYERLHEKEDLISYLKTEELFNLLYRMLEHNPNLEVLNDPNIEGDSLNIKIKS